MIIAPLIIYPDYNAHRSDNKIFKQLTKLSIYNIGDQQKKRNQKGGQHKSG